MAMEALFFTLVELLVLNQFFFSIRDNNKLHQLFTYFDSNLAKGKLFCFLVYFLVIDLSNEFHRLLI